MSNSVETSDILEQALEEADEQAKALARVALAGWTITPVPGLTGVTRYKVEDATGRYRYNASTRYSAAVMAETLIWHSDEIEDIWPSDPGIAGAT